MSIYYAKENKQTCYDKTEQTSPFVVFPFPYTYIYIVLVLSLLPELVSILSQCFQIRIRFLIF